jgi:hypothetical protein
MPFRIEGILETHFLLVYVFRITVQVDRTAHTYANESIEMHILIAVVPEETPYRYSLEKLETKPSSRDYGIMLVMDDVFSFILPMVLSVGEPYGQWPPY